MYLYTIYTYSTGALIHVNIASKCGSKLKDIVIQIFFTEFNRKV